jgi:acyl-CoA thioesterase-2
MTAPWPVRTVRALPTAPAERPSALAITVGDSACMAWLRASQTLPDDPLLHVCAVTYASDLTLLDAVLLGSGLAWDERTVTGASLDHAMWFHGPFRADEWLLYVQESPAASGARGLARGQVFRRDGRLVASVVQEGLIRVSSPD